MARAKKEAAVADEKAKAVADEKAKTVVIQLPVIEGMSDSVYVCVNMKSYQIKRGEPVEVPLSVAEVLRNSDRQNMVAMQRQEEMASKNYGEM